MPDRHWEEESKSVNPMSPAALRSPREHLGGYILLPRLIDKVRLHAEGRLPQEYAAYLLKPGLTLDGWFLAFTDLDREKLREAILAGRSDEEILAWIERHARPHTDTEKRRWADEIDAYRPEGEAAHRRRVIYAELAARIDVAAVSILDLIDIDEGRRPVRGIPP